MKSSQVYTRRFVIAAVLYTIFTLLAGSLADEVQPLILRYFLVVLPVLPVAYGMFAYIRHLRTMDELQRRIQLEGLSFSVGLTGIITLTLGFLELAGLPPIGILWAFPMLMGFWGIGAFLARRGYQ